VLGRAASGSINRARARRGAPLFACTWLLSATARDQSVVTKGTRLASREGPRRLWFVFLRYGDAEVRVVRRRRAVRRAILTVVWVVTALALAVVVRAVRAHALVAPANTELPSLVVAPGLGSHVTPTQGRWTGSPTSFSYQYLRCPDGGGAAAKSRPEVHESHWRRGGLGEQARHRKARGHQGAVTYMRRVCDEGCCSYPGRSPLRDLILLGIKTSSLNRSEL
jgi:hypothetical protein